MGLGSNIEELDEAAQAQVRMNALLQESGNIQQAAIKDTGGLTNSTKSLKGIWNEFMADARFEVCTGDGKPVWNYPR